MSNPEFDDVGENRSSGEKAGARRRAFWEDFGVDAPDYLSEEGMPPVDRAKLAALEQNQLEAEERKRVIGYIARYRSWAKAYGLLIADKFGGREGPAKTE